MILAYFPLYFMYLGLEFIILCLGTHVLLSCGHSLRVNRFMELQLRLLLLLFPGESLPFAGQSFHVSLEIGDSVLLVPDFDELLLSNTCPCRLDLSLESDNGAQLLLLIMLVLLMQLF